MNLTLQPDQSAENEWREIVQAAPEVCREAVAELMSEHASVLADNFYTHMLGHPQAKVFLTAEVVNQRLHASMGRWLKEIFQHPHQEPSAIVAHQLANDGKKRSIHPGDGSVVARKNRG